MQYKEESILSEIWFWTLKYATTVRPTRVYLHHLYFIIGGNIKSMILAFYVIHPWENAVIVLYATTIRSSVANQIIERKKNDDSPKKSIGPPHIRPTLKHISLLVARNRRSRWCNKIKNMRRIKVSQCHYSNTQIKYWYAFWKTRSHLIISTLTQDSTFRRTHPNNFTTKEGVLKLQDTKRK